MSLNSIEPIPEHRRNGKVAQLPKALRDRINLLMLDGLTYLEIIAELGDEGKHLNEDNLGNWKSGGYTQWLKSNEQRQTMLVVQEAIIDRALKMGRPDLSKAVIQMAVTKAFQILEMLTLDKIQSTMDSNNFTRLLNALAKLADGEIKCERIEAENADRDTARQKKRIPSGLSPESIQEIQEHRFTPPEQFETDVIGGNPR